jgi:hypothetical protein
VKAPAPTTAAIEAAETAQLHAPARAKIATEKTAVRMPLTKPLTSLAPVAEVHHATTSGANTVNPNVEHSAATAPFTGEPVKPAPTYKPQTESPGGETYHPSYTPPAQTYHPETQSPENQTYHPSYMPPAKTYMPQSQSSESQSYHPSSTPPAETYHPESQGNGGGAAVHAEAAPVHSAPAGGQGGKPSGNGGQKAAGDKNKPQG